MRNWTADIDSSCVLCLGPMETRSHLFFDCRYSKEVWSRLTSKLLDSKFSTNWEAILNLLPDKTLHFDCLFLIKYSFQLTIHSLWKERNGQRHGEASTNHVLLARLLNKHVKNRISFIQEQGNSKYDGCMSTWLTSR